MVKILRKDSTGIYGFRDGVKRRDGANSANGVKCRDGRGNITNGRDS